jgi:hypothetical protein
MGKIDGPDYGYSFEWIRGRSGQDTIQAPLVFVVTMVVEECDGAWRLRIYCAGTILEEQKLWSRDLAQYKGAEWLKEHIAQQPFINAQS